MCCDLILLFISGKFFTIYGDCGENNIIKNMISDILILRQHSFTVHHIPLIVITIRMAGNQRHQVSPFLYQQFLHICRRDYPQFRNAIRQRFPKVENMDFVADFQLFDISEHSGTIVTAVSGQYAVRVLSADRIGGFR